MLLPKQKRIKSPATLRKYAEDHPYCEHPDCGSWQSLDVHHIQFKGQQGSDIPENLITLCRKHHTKAHGKDSRAIRELYLRLKEES